ncbi:discoidin domain-containing protein [Carboxylicivirga marina]|uniref:Discoidin domain-containing protein n=1 Tax=Carboxylicivirga marina TaxID=2800988 RepID=A0ABS1HPX6_9BACT|nr:discoidin domain-containing protein [Carboxylicivirga marina]MBK3519665.1 discoidin domain-containing protein [Carboxylicivirga marina]
MKKILLLNIVFVGLLFTSCLKHDLEDLPAFGDTEIISFDFEYRWIESDTIKDGNTVIEVRDQVKVEKMNYEDYSMDTENGTINVVLSAPSSIPSEVAENIELTMIWGYADISTAAKIKPIGDAPVLGKPGDYSVEREYLVTAANGATQKWTINTTLSNKYVLDKSGWAIVDASPFVGDSPVTNVIDGNLGTFWHTPWNASQVPGGEVPDHPHYFTIDMGELKTVVGVTLFKRQTENNGSDSHEVWVSADNEVFTLVAAYDKQIPDNNGVLLPITIQDVRYVKYIAVSGPQVFTHLGELDVIGLK